MPRRGPFRAGGCGIEGIYLYNMTIAISAARMAQEWLKPLSIRYSSSDGHACHARSQFSNCTW